MKKYFLLPIFVSLIAVIAFIFQAPQNHNQRADYEKFLLEEYSNIPVISEQELENMPGPNQPDMAAMQNFLMTVDPAKGFVPKDRLIEAYHQTKSLQETSKFKNSTRSLEWENIPAMMGGRSRALMYDPNYPASNKVWTGGVTGGLWYNNDVSDEDSQWVAIDDFWSNLSISCITYDPNDLQTFYVGTGESHTALITYRESSGVGAGIYKSENGGISWDLLPSTETFAYVNDIKVRNENGISVIYAGVVSGIYMGEIHQSIPTDGLYRSVDGGLSWEQVFPDITNCNVPFAPSTIAIQSDNRIYVGTMANVDGEGGATILISDNGTTGSWTVYEDYRIIIENNSQYYLPGRVIMVPAPSDENILYAIIGAGYINGFPYYRGRYILKTTNKGETWTSINKPDNGDWANLAWHAMIGVVDPNDADNLFVGGLDVHKTTNSGNTWRHVSDWALMYYGGGDEYVHADQHAQVYKANSSTEAIFASDGGIFYTSTATLNYPIFKQRNNHYTTLQFYSCDLSPTPGLDRYIGGLQDNGTLYYTGDPLSIQDMVDGGDGAYCFFDYDQSQYFITSVYYNRYSTFVNGNEYNYVGDYQSGIFINPADYDYKLNILYANAVSFSGNYQDKILRLSEMLSNSPDGDFVSLNTGSDVYFSHVKYSPYSPDGQSTIFVGSQSGRLFKVENAQANVNVTEIGSNDFPPANISCIAIGGSEDTLLVTFSNYGVPSIYQTYNGGDSWQLKEGNIPDFPIRWAIYHPQNASNAMLATEIGVWTSSNLDEADVTWTPDVEGMANVRVDMLKLREADNTVLAASHGRGLFTSTYNYDPSVSIDEDVITGIKVYPNPATDKVVVSFSHAEISSVDVVITDIAGKEVFRDEYSSGQSKVDMTIDMNGWNNGIYILNIISGDTAITEKIIKN